VALILETTLQVRSAAAYAVLILALVPPWLIGGLSGAFLQPIVISYGLAVLASMIVALLLTPALSLMLLGRAQLARREPPLVGWLQRGYGRALAPIVRTPTPSRRRARCCVVASRTPIRRWSAARSATSPSWCSRP
jgi:Cu/Ag efflux pump CusA